MTTHTNTQDYSSAFVRCFQVSLISGGGSRRGGHWDRRSASNGRTPIARCMFWLDMPWPSTSTT